MDKLMDDFSQFVFSRQEFEDPTTDSHREREEFYKVFNCLRARYRDNDNVDSLFLDLESRHNAQINYAKKEQYMKGFFDCLKLSAMTFR